MKDSKKQKGTQIKLTKGKRVSLRCPLTIDKTDLEYNYDASCAQICLTVENMGGGGTTDDCVESAIVVIRLYDAQGALLPCGAQNEYFAKLLRFGEQGLQSGSHITFRLTPDCDGGSRIADAELYISRVRFTDGTVTDYLRGDFFDLPGDALPLQKKYKKNMAEIAQKFGSSALYVPEELTDIIWRCTCGEFCESDHCTSCGASKAELFDFFAPSAPKVAPAENSGSADGANDGAFDGSSDENSAATAPATDATTEYHTGIFTSGEATDNTAPDNKSSDGTADSGQASDSETGSANSYTMPLAKEKDKMKIGLIAGIIASGVLLVAIVVMLIVMLVIRGKKPAEKPVDGTTSSIVDTTDAPDVTDPPISQDEKIVRIYLEQHQFDNALEYARKTDCSDELIREILNAAVKYYTETEPNADKAMEYAEQLEDSASLNAVILQNFKEAMAKGDYQAALEAAAKLSGSEKDKKTAEAAEGLLQSQLTSNDFDAALQTAKKYATTTTAEKVVEAAVDHYINKRQYDKAISMAREANNEALAVTAAEAAVTYYVGQQNYDRAADYVGLTHNESAVQALLPQFNKPSIKKHLPTFFPYLSFEDKQAVHASVMSANGGLGVIDVYGNAYWGSDGVYNAADTGKKAISIKCSKLTTVLLLEDGKVLAFGDNSYGQCDVTGWSDIVAIDASDCHTVGLKSDGSVVAAGRSGEKQCDVGQYSGVVAIAAGGYHTMVLLSDGTVRTTGMTASGQCNTGKWENIVAISAGFLHSVGLKADGTVVTAGSTTSGRCGTGDWSNVIQISAGNSCTVGLTADGKLLLASDGNENGNVSSISGVILVSAGTGSVTMLQTDGNLLATGDSVPSLSYVSQFEISTTVYGVH